MLSFLSQSPLKRQDCGLRCVFKENALSADKGHILQNSLRPTFLLWELVLDFKQKYSSFPGVHAGHGQDQGGLDDGSWWCLSMRHKGQGVSASLPAAENSANSALIRKLKVQGCGTLGSLAGC